MKSVKLLIIGMMLTFLPLQSEISVFPWASADATILFIERAKPYLPIHPKIVDAGAFTGNESIFMATYLQATVYAFEPDPNNFITLKKATRNIPNIICYPWALSDKKGISNFYQSAPATPYSGSLLKPKEHLNYSDVIFPSQIHVKTITLDAWALQQGIDHIDFLWLDMQGMELSVLKASPNILKTVRAIYTEVELVEAYEGQPLYEEVKEWLESQGFTMIAKDFVDGDPGMWFGNILMVRLS